MTTVDLGDQITRKEIRATPCPVHGQHCEAYGPFTPCRARIKRAIYLKHAVRMKALHGGCLACREGHGYHVHFGG